jgi:hypothetical protein
VDVARIELLRALKARELLILRNCKKEKNHRNAEVRYTSGTRKSYGLNEERPSSGSNFLVWSVVLPAKTGQPNAPVTLGVTGNSKIHFTDTALIRHWVLKSGL